MLVGRNGCYRVLDVLKPGSVFKAVVEATNPKASTGHQSLTRVQDLYDLTLRVVDVPFYELTAFFMVVLSSRPHQVRI